MMEVAPLALDLLVRAPQPADRLRTAMAAMRAAGNVALRLRQPLLSRTVVAWIVDGAPAAVTRNTRSPTSMPVAHPVSGNGSTGTSAQARHTYQPSASLLMVIVL